MREKHIHSKLDARGHDVEVVRKAMKGRNPMGPNNKVIFHKLLATFTLDLTRVDQERILPPLPSISLRSFVKPLKSKTSK